LARVKVLLTLAAVLAAVACALPPAARAATCHPPRYPGSGYFTSLKVHKTSCRTGRRLALAYRRCRVKHGGLKGRCPGGVMGYKCHEHRGDSIPTEFDARVTCTRGSRKIVHTYQQNT
jgi:hypothetical protein